MATEAAMKATLSGARRARRRHGYSLTSSVAMLHHLCSHRHYSRTVTSHINGARTKRLLRSVKRGGKSWFYSDKTIFFLKKETCYMYTRLVACRELA